MRELSQNVNIKNLTFFSAPKNKQKTSSSLDDLNVNVSTTNIAEHSNTCVCYKVATMTTQTLPIIINKMWSHIVWSVCHDPVHGYAQQGERHRHASHFESAQCIVLDIDNKDEAVYLPMVDAQKMLSDLELLHVIAPTSSHQCEIDKSGNPCAKVDKYRILLFLDKPITNLETYTTVYKNLLEFFPAADTSAKDAARQWYPRINQYDKTILRENEKIYCTLLKDGYTLDIDVFCKECHGSSQKSAGTKVRKTSKEAKSVTPVEVQEIKDACHGASVFFELVNAKYLPGTGRNDAIVTDIIRLRNFGCRMAEARQFLSSRTVFDKDYPFEKLEKAVDWGYNKAQLKTKYDYKVSDSTLEECEFLKFEIVKKILKLDEKDEDFDGEDLAKAQIVIFDNKVWVKTPKRAAVSFSASGLESCCQFISAPAHRTKTVSTVLEDGKELSGSVSDRVEDRKVVIREVLKSNNFLKTQVDNVLGLAYYPSGETIIDNCLNTYIQPHFFAADHSFNDDLDLFLRIVKTVVNNNEHYVNWLLNWIRHLIEYPNQPLTRHPVILAPQGCCKGTLYTILEGLLGGNCLSIKGDDVFGKEAKFNSVVCTENVLICLDELKMTASMVPEFKRLFKNTHQSKFEKKCVQGFKTRRIANFLILGNVEENVLSGLKSDERSIYPIKWEDPDFIKGSPKFEAAYGLFKELEKRMTKHHTLRDMLSRQFVSNIYHYIMSLEYSRDLLDEPLNEIQKIEAFDDNLTLREQEFIATLLKKRRIVFQISELTEKPDNFCTWNYAEQMEFNRNVEQIHKFSRQRKLKDLIRRAGFVVDVRLNRGVTVCIYKPFKYLNHSDLETLLKTKTRYTEVQYSEQENTRLLEGGGFQVLHDMNSE